MKIVVNSDSRLGECIAKARKLFHDKKYLVVTLKTGRDRTLDQNRLWFAMYKRIAEVLEGYSVEDARRYCKLHLGVPIMRAECEEFQQRYDEMIKPMDYERKLDLMGPNPLLGPDGFPVTRLFNRKQGIQYTEAIVAEFQQQGVFFGDILEDESSE